MVNYPNNLTVAVGHNVFINLVTGYENTVGYHAGVNVTS
jgi:hypothetical protein